MYLEIFLADFAEIPEFRGSATARNIRSPEKRGGEIFADHNLPSGDQKFILDRQLAPVLKS